MSLTIAHMEGNQVDTLKVKIQTLTPIWTGGVDRTCDRLHETGIIGSLRSWYEAVVRGLGGKACDPTSEHAGQRCQFSSDAYSQARKEGKPHEEALAAGLKTVCPVCYLFGTTGWARLFTLRVSEVQTVPLHFRTVVGPNKGWLLRIFGGENHNIASQQVPFGTISFDIVWRRNYGKFVQRQLSLLFTLAAEYGGIGARLQHGFGLFRLVSPLDEQDIREALKDLKNRISSGLLGTQVESSDDLFSLQNLIVLDCEIPRDRLIRYLEKGVHIGSATMSNEHRYIPCAFDLRYKMDSDHFGLRQWLKQQGWKETNDPKKWEELDLLLGPRAQWSIGKKAIRIHEDYRRAGSVAFGMPYLKEGCQDVYMLRVLAFWRPSLKARLRSPEDLKKLLKTYVLEVFNIEDSKVTERTGKEFFSKYEQVGNGA